MELIYAGHEEENNIKEGAYNDGAHDEVLRGDKRTVVIKTVGYTGWRIVGITPHKNLSLNSVKTKLFFAFVIGFILFAIALVNSYISAKITDPIKELEKSVMDLEDGNLGVEVYTGGSYEIEHLGKSVKKMAVRMQNLMDDIVIEHEAKRKSEFDTLQSQINPHFLYNTLDIIVWMIENDKPDEAVRAVTALARFFRISLSKGKTLITVRDELEHVRNYLTIQNMRFKNKFTYTIEAQEDVKNLSSIKLILQPLVENSIYHGMEFMDGEGLIEIKAWKEADDLYISVGDNGLGMKQNIVDNLMSETKHVSSKRGSGIGVKNVNERIKIYFGEQYGIDIQSEPDEGTLIIVHLPAISYNDIDGREQT